MGWGILSFNIIVLGCTLLFTLNAIANSFPDPVSPILFAFYIWFAAPVVVGWTAFMFLKSVIAEGRLAAKLGLMCSIAVLGLWAVMLAVQFEGSSRTL
jgi:hypothetical protein